MVTGTGDALEWALALAKAPAERTTLRQRALPGGMERLLQVAAGVSNDTLEDLAAQTGESGADIVEAARFYAREVLFYQGADAYRVLGVAHDADTDTIRTHHRLLQQWLHPDRHTSDWDAIFAARVNAAWYRLRSDQRRQAYDLENPPQQRDPMPAKLVSPTWLHPQEVGTEEAGPSRLRRRAPVFALFAVCGVLAVLAMRDMQREPAGLNELANAGVASAQKIEDPFELRIPDQATNRSAVRRAEVRPESKPAAVAVVPKPAPKPVAVAVVPKPAPKPVMVAVVPKLVPKPMVAAAVPKPVAVAAVGKPAPKPIAVAVVAKPVPKPVAVAVVAKPAPKPIAVAVVAKPVPKPVAVAVVAKPAPKPIAVAVVAKPVPKSVAVAVVAKPVPKLAAVAVVAKPVPKPVAVAALPKPVSKPAAVAVVAKPVPKPVTVAVAVVPKPTPKPAAVAVVAKPAPKPVAVAVVARPVPNPVAVAVVAKPSPKPAVIFSSPKPELIPSGDARTRVADTQALPVVAATTSASSSVESPSVAMQRSKQAQQVGGQLMAFMAKSGSAIPPIWGSLSTQRGATQLRGDLHGNGVVKLDPPHWRVGDNTASMQANIRYPDGRIGRMSADFAWREQRWLVTGLSVERDL